MRKKKRKDRKKQIKSEANQLTVQEQHHLDKQKKKAAKLNRQAERATDESHRVALTAFYQKHNPDRIPTVNKVLFKHKGKMEKLFNKIKQKYGEAPEELLSTPHVHGELSRNLKKVPKSAGNKLGRRPGALRAKKTDAFLTNVIAAVRALRERQGSNRYAIQRWLLEHTGEDRTALLQRSLLKGVKLGKLEKNGALFKVAGDAHDEYDNDMDADSKEMAGTRGFATRDIAMGKGALATSGCKVTLSYTGKLKSTGTEFDSGKLFQFVIDNGEVIKGWDLGIKGMRVGGVRLIVVPPALGYGPMGSDVIPPDATLLFTVRLLSVKSSS